MLGRAGVSFWALLFSKRMFFERGRSLCLFFSPDMLAMTDPGDGHSWTPVRGECWQQCHRWPPAGAFVPVSLFLHEAPSNKICFSIRKIILACNCIPSVFFYWTEWWLWPSDNQQCPGWADPTCPQPLHWTYLGWKAWNDRHRVPELALPEASSAGILLVVLRSSVSKWHHAGWLKAC